MVAMSSLALPRLIVKRELCGCSPGLRSPRPQDAHAVTLLAQALCARPDKRESPKRALVYAALDSWSMLCLSVDSKHLVRSRLLLPVASGKPSVERHRLDTDSLARNHIVDVPVDHHVWNILTSSFRSELRLKFALSLNQVRVLRL